MYPGDRWSTHDRLLMIAWNIYIYKNSIPFLVHLLSPAVPFSTPQQKGRVLILEITGMRHSIVEWLLGETVKKRNRSTHDLLYMFSLANQIIRSSSRPPSKRVLCSLLASWSSVTKNNNNKRSNSNEEYRWVIGMGLQLNSIDSLLHFIHFKGRIELRLIRQCFCCCCCCRY